MQHNPAAIPFPLLSQQAGKRELESFPFLLSHTPLGGGDGKGRMGAHLSQLVSRREYS
jgi:hypothetical protein